MTDLRLTKHHGLGNDFLVALHADIDDPAGLARRLCDRSTGIGADGLLIGEPAEGYAAKMVLHNADGSRAEMSGNGIRCFAQALAMQRGDVNAQLISTDAGDRLVEIEATADPQLLTASVEMGEIGRLAEPDGWQATQCHPDRPVAHLSMGNPHSVVGVDEVAAVDLAALGALVPQINLEIVEPGPETNAITLRVHERGAGITKACGTGACASAYAATQWGLVAPDADEVLVHMDGGTASVRLSGEARNQATLVGPAVYVGSVEVPMP